jgi:hypothetical protein
MPFEHNGSNVSMKRAIYMTNEGVWSAMEGLCLCLVQGNDLVALVFLGDLDKFGGLVAFGGREVIAGGVDGDILYRHV